MEITEVRIKLMEEQGERLKAFCSITFDHCFVVRDLKIIEGTNGPFVAMPSRKLAAHCPRCRSKNHLRAQHCNQCGSSLAGNRMMFGNDGRAKLYADIAHPINSACREMIQQRVVEEFEAEIERAKLPNYTSRYDDFDIDFEEQPAAKTDTRIDPAHSPQAAHAPHPGGTAPPAHTSSGTPPPGPTSAQQPRRPVTPPQREEGDFGSGILPPN
jgi:stage V sporulation protein G